VSLGLRLVAMALGLAAYAAGAIGAVVAVKRVGVDLADVASRTSSRVLLIGAVANALVLAAVLSLNALLLHRSAFGFGATPSSLVLSLVGAVVTFVSAAAFLRARRTVRIASSEGSGALSLALLVLALVAAQEEVLFRGYLVALLEGLPSAAIVAITTVVFVGVHFPTNKVSRSQIVSWTMGGLVLVIAYLATGSLWVPIVLHFATDAANVLVFRITQTDGWFAFEPPLRSSERAVYRVIYAVVMTVLVWGWCSLWPPSPL